MLISTVALLHELGNASWSVYPTNHARTSLVGVHRWDTSLGKTVWSWGNWRVSSDLPVRLWFLTCLKTCFWAFGVDISSLVSSSMGSNSKCAWTVGVHICYPWRALPKTHLQSVPFSAPNFSIVIQLSYTIQSTCVPSTLHLHVKDHSRHHWTHAQHRQDNSRAVSGGVVTAGCMHYVSVVWESRWQSHPDWFGEFRSDQDFTTPIGSFAGVLDCPSGAALDPPDATFEVVSAAAPACIP